MNSSADAGALTLVAPFERLFIVHMGLELLVAKIMHVSPRILPPRIHTRGLRWASVALEIFFNIQITFHKMKYFSHFNLVERLILG